MLVVYLVCLLLPAFQPSMPAPQPAATEKAPYISAGEQKLEINLPALKFFCDGRQGDLKRYLEASPRWRVGIERQGDRDVTVAYRRAGTRITLNGYIGGSTQTRVGFAFEEKPPEPDFMTPCVTQAAPDAGVTTVVICSPRLLPSKRIAHLNIGAAKLWLAIVESDKSGKLPLIPRLLAEVQTELDNVRKSSENGDPLAALSPSATHKGTASLTIDDSKKQELELEAWVNPGEAGITEIRVKSSDGKNDLTISHAHLYTRERIGYSADPTQLFYANSIFCINEIATGWDSKHDLKFQLWFTPDSGGPARQIIEHRQTVSGYEH